MTEGIFFPFTDGPALLWLVGVINRATAGTIAQHAIPGVGQTPLCAQADWHINTNIAMDNGSCKWLHPL
jgi:hypothetical protein